MQAQKQTKSIGDLNGTPENGVWGKLWPKYNSSRWKSEAHKEKARGKV